METMKRRQSWDEKWDLLLGPSHFRFWKILQLAMCEDSRGYLDDHPTDLVTLVTVGPWADRSATYFFRKEAANPERRQTRSPG